MSDSVRSVMQIILQDARKRNPGLYEMSPGQIPSHVDHRVAGVIAERLERVLDLDGDDWGSSQIGKPVYTLIEPAQSNDGGE